jgi:hypothetical protein
MRMRGLRSAAFVSRMAALAAIFSLTALGAAAAAGRHHVTTRRTMTRQMTTRQLDRIAYAVDGAESSHGKNPAMWRLDPAGPQGPMQVSAKAATDVGGGDRFDTAQNRAIGRAYLAQLYRRYDDWPDAIAAYNWGLGNVDAWIRAGRPADKLLSGVVNYLHRVLRDSGLCNNAAASTNCGAQFLGGDTAAWRAVLVAARESTGRPAVRIVQTPFDQALTQAALMARQFGAQQSALEQRLDTAP